MRAEPRGLWRLGVLVVLVAVATPAAGQLPPVLNWVEDLHVVVRINRQLVSNYDMAVEVAVDRMLQDESLSRPPTAIEWRQALGRIVLRMAVRDTADRFVVSPPSNRRLREVEQRLTQRYGVGRAFEQRTGVSLEAVRSQLSARGLLENYISEVVLPSLQVSDEQLAQEYDLAATEAPDHGSRLRETLEREILLKAVRRELVRLRERFLDRAEVTFLDRQWGYEDLVRGWMPAEPLDASEPVTGP